MNYINKTILTFLGVTFFVFSAHAQPTQHSGCNSVVPFQYIDMTGAPDSLVVTPIISRAGSCCGSKTPSQRCVSFTVLLDVNAQGIVFDLGVGAGPTGSLKWKIGCGPEYDIGQQICLTGVGPHEISFCKPGNNENNYIIRSIPKPSASPPTAVSDGCTAQIFAGGFDPATIVWTALAPPADIPLYNSFADCLTCDTVNLDISSYSGPPLPPFIEYQVTGSPLGGCNGTTVSLTVKVFFINDKAVIIEPKDPVICFGGIVASVTANAFLNGGAPPYTYIWSTGETETTMTSSTINVGVGTYSVIMFDTTDCPPVYDTVTVTANPSPISANAGGPYISCENNPNVQLNGSVIIATGGQWSGYGGTFASGTDTILNDIYTPSAAEIAAGNLNLTLSTTGNGLCPVSNDVTTITIAPTPIVNPGGPYTVCENNAQVVLSGSVTNAGGGRWSGGAGTFLPNDSSLNATYTPTAGEIIVGTPLVLTLTSIQNGSCIPVAQTVNVNFSPAAVVFAGNDDTICANNAVVTLNGSVTGPPTTTGVWSNGLGTFSSTTNLNATYTPTAGEITAGFVDLILTSTSNATCLPVKDTVRIFITPSPTIDAGLPQSVCANNSGLTLNGTVTQSTGGVWSNFAGTMANPNNLGSAYTAPTVAGSEFIYLTSTGNGNCLAVVDSVKITVTPPPVVFAGLDDTICANNPVINLTGTVGPTGPTTTGVWTNGGGPYNTSNTDLTGTYTATAAEITAGTVSLILTSTTNLSCLAEDDTVNITIAAAPTVSAGLTDTVCSNNLLASLNANFSVATGVTWSGGTGTFSSPNTAATNYTPSATEIATGTVNLTVTTTGNGNCAAVSDVVPVLIEQAPVVNAGPSQILCATSTSVSLAASIVSADGSPWTGGGIWSGGAGTFPSGNTNLTGTYNPTAAEITSGSLRLILTSTNNGSCIQDADTLNITFVPGPVANAGGPYLACDNKLEVDLIDPSNPPSVTNTANFIWQGNGIFLPSSSVLNPTFILNNPFPATFTRVRLIAISSNVCPNDTSVADINIAPGPTVSAGLSDTSCTNNPILSLLGAAVPIQPSGTPLWSNGAGIFSSPNTNATNYTPTAAEISAGFVDLIYSTNYLPQVQDCNRVFDTIRVFIDPTPIVNAGSPQTVCANNNVVTLNGTVVTRITPSTGIWTNAVPANSGSFTNSSNLITQYTPSAFEVNQGFADLILTSTSNGSCLPVSSTVRITITPAPQVNNVIDDTTCANNASLVLGGSITGPTTTGTWTGGTGIFTPNRNVINPTYIPSAAEITAGSVVLTLNSTNNGNCNPVTDAMTVFISDPPTADAGNDTTVCADNPSVTLKGIVTIATGGQWTGGNGTFNPSANNLNAVYTPSATEIANGSVTLTLITTGNGNCNPVASAKTITINPPPTVDAGSNQDVCGDLSPVTLNGVVTLANGGIWTTNGTGTFADNTVLGTNYTPTIADTTAGSINLTLTTTGNRGCNSRSETITINFISAPTVEAGLAQTVCTTDLPVVLNGSGSLSNWSSPTSGTFSPSPAILNATYQPSTADINNGFVTLTLTTVANAFCPSISDNVDIFLPPGPTVFAGNDTTVCGFNNNITLNGQFTIAGAVKWTSLGTGSFNNDAIANAVYTFSALDKANGNVSLILTTELNGLCQAVDDTINITILDDIITFAGNNLTACADVAGINLAGSVQGASGGIWTTSGDGNFTPTDTSLNGVYVPGTNDRTPGNITLTLTSTGNGGCPADIDDIIITITPAPTVNAGPDTITICADSPGVPLTGVVTVATNGNWTSTGTGTFSPSGSTLSTTYIPSSNDTINSNQPIYLILESSNNGTCNAVVDTIVLVITPVPVVRAGQDQTVCADNLTVNLAGTVLHAGGGLWSTSGTGSFSSTSNLNATYNLSAQDSAAGLVVITLKSDLNGTCNQYQDQMLINITPAPTVNPGSNLNVCASVDSISLNGNVTVANGGKWTTTGTGQFLPNDIDLNAFYIPSAADTTAGAITITLTSTGNGTCQPVSGTINVVFTSVPTVDAGPAASVCSDISSFQLNGLSTNSSGIVWSSGGTGSFSPSTTDPNAVYVPSVQDSINGSVVFTLTSTGTGSCPSAVATKILTLTPGVVVFAGNNTTVCADTAGIQLAGAVANAAGGIWNTTGSGSFLPNDTTLNAIYIPSSFDTAAGSVSLNLISTGNGGCLARNDAFTINILPAPTVFAGPDRTQCITSGSVPLTGQFAHAGGAVWSTINGGGSFSTSNTDMNGAYILVPNDTTFDSIRIILTTTLNGLCKAVDDTFTVFFDPLVEVEAGEDSSICVDINGFQLAGTFANAVASSWTTSGTGIFSPDANNLNAIYVPSAADKTAGGVTLTLTSNTAVACPDRFDNLILTITPAPTVFAGLDDTLCKSSPIINLNGQITTATGGTWSTASGQGTFGSGVNSLTGIFTPSATQLNTGSVILTLTTTGNGTCNVRTDQRIVRFQKLPNVTASPDQIVCADNPSIAISATVLNAGGIIWSSPGTGTFAATDTSKNAFYNYSNQERLNGSATLFVNSTENGVCPADIDTVNLTITPAPTVTVSSSATCADETGVDLNGVVTISSGLTWSSTGTGIFTPNIFANSVMFTPSAADLLAGIPIKVYLTSTGNGNCNAVVDSSLLLNVHPAPTVNAGLNRLICADQNSISLTGTRTNSTSSIWTSTGGGSFGNPNALTTQYVPTALDKSNGTVILYLTTNDPTVCKQKYDSIIVTITPSPTLDAGPPQTVCANNDTVTVTAIKTVSTGVTWSASNGGTFSNPNSLTTQYFPSAADRAAGSVYLVATSTGNGLCNVRKDSLLLTINPSPTLNAISNSLTACSSDNQISMGYFLTNAGGATWTTTGSGTLNNTLINNVKYITSAADLLADSILFFGITTNISNLCFPDRDTIVLFIDPEPTSVITLPNLCTADDSIALIGDTTNASSFFWTTNGTGFYTPDTFSSLTPFYVRSNADSIAGSATVYLNVVGSAACATIIDSVELNLSPPPNASAGPNQIVCQDTAGIQLDGSYSFATGAFWTTTNGSGTFTPNINDTIAIYIPAAADTALDSVVIFLTTTGNGACDADVDTVKFVVTPAPTVDAGPGIVCENSGPVNLNGVITVATGGLWSSSSSDLNFGSALNQLNNIYTPSATDIGNGFVDLTLTTTGNGDCKAYFDVLTINIASAPTVTTVADRFVCGDRDTVQMSANFINASGVQWSTLGNGTFTNGNTTTAIYNIDPQDVLDDSVILIVETQGNGICLPDYDTIVFYFTPIPQVLITNDVACSEAPSINIIGSVSVATSSIWSNPAATGGTFGNVNDTSTTYSPSALDLLNDSVKLVLTSTGNGDCKAYDDTLTLYFLPTPTVDAGTPQTVCADTAFIQLNGSFGGTAIAGAWTSSGTGTFSPDTFNINSTYIPDDLDTLAGFVTLYYETILNNNCPIIKDSVLYTISPAPVLTVGPGQTVCADTLGIDLSSSISNAGGVSWSSSNTISPGTFTGGVTSLTPTYVPSASDTTNGSVQLIVQTTGVGSCKVLTDTVDVIITPAPTINPGGSPLCSDNPIIPLNAQITVASGISWTTSGTGFFSNAQSTNTNYVRSTADSIAGAVTLYAVTTNNGSCKPVLDSIELFLIPAPSVSAGSDISICDAQTIVPIGGSFSDAGGIVWTTNGGGTFDDPNGISTNYNTDPQDVIDSVITIYITTILNGGCNPDVDSFYLDIRSPSPQSIPGNNLTVCADAPFVQLNGNVTGAISGTWTTSGTGTFAPNANTLAAKYFPSNADTLAGNVTLSLTTTGNGICTPDIQGITVTFTNSPLIDAGPIVNVCADNPLGTLNGSDGGNSVYWTTSGSGTFGDTSQAVTTYTPSLLDIGDSTITFTLFTTGAGGCQVVSSQTTMYISPPPSVDPGFPQTICADEPSINLGGSVTNAGGGLWTTSGSGTFGNDTILNTTYAPSVGDTTAGFVYLTLEATNTSAGCNARMDSILLTINDGVTISAGASQLVCLNAQSVTLTGAVTNAQTGQWTTLNGLGTFSPNPQGLIRDYFFSGADKLKDSIGFVLLSVGNGTCFPKTDTTWAVYVPNPVADAGQPITVCEDAPNATLNGSVTVTGKGQWATAGSGIFVPNDTTLNAVYQPSAADILAGGVNLSLTSRDNGDCSPATDFVSITILPSPTVEPGPDVLLCFAESDITLNAQTAHVGQLYWSTNGDGIFADSTVLNAQYIFGANDKSSGSVTLTLNSNDNNLCIPVSEDIIISFRPEVTINAGSPVTVCADVPSVDLSGVFANATSASWSSTGFGNFTPNPNVNNVTYFFDSLDYIAGVIGMTFQTDNSVCPSVSDAINVTITPTPTVEVGPAINVCASDDSVSLNAVINNIPTGVIWSSSGSGSFSPNNTSLITKYVPSALDVITGTVLLTATTTGNGTCNPVSDNLLLTFRPDPIVSAGPDIDACANSTGVPLNGQVFNANGGIWTSSGTGQFSPAPTTLTASYIPSATDTANGVPITLTLTSTDNLGCPAAAGDVILNLQPEPVVSTGDVDACADQTGIVLNGQISNSPGGIWTTSGTGVFAPSASNLSPIYSPSAADFVAGLVTLTLSTTGSGVCAEKSDDATVIITPLPVAIAGDDQTVCRNSFATVVPFIEPGNSYEWYTLNNVLVSNQAVADIFVSSDTSFILKVEDVNGCTQFDTVDVFVVDPPVFNLIDQICFSFGTTLSSNPSFNPSLGTYQWYIADSLLAGQNTEDVVVSKEGTYIIIYNYESCNVLDSSQVTPLPILEGPDVYVCEDDSARILTNYYEGATYQWFKEGIAFGADTNEVGGLATDSIFFQVRVTDSLGCINRDTILLIPVPPPIMTLEDNPGCIGDVITLSAVPLNIIDSLKSEYQWFVDGDILPSDTFPTLTVTEEGLYKAIYKLGGCVAEDQADITLNLPPIPDNLASVQWCKELAEFVLLDAGPGGTKYFWYYNDDTTQTSEIDDFGYFDFDIINEFGCIANDSILVTEVCPPQLFVPNAFSPNSDGLDDFFNLFGRNYKNLDFKIYNRWGEVIFFSDDVDNSWDGNFRGQPIPIGVYPWTAEYEGTFPGQEGPFRLKGSVTVIR